MSNIKIKGNRFFLWLGDILTKRGNRLIKKGEVRNVTSYSANLVDPFIIVVKFTVNGNKYHILNQGNYKEKYKEHGTNDLPLAEDEFSHLIKDQRSKWFSRK